MSEHASLLQQAKAARRLAALLTDVDAVRVLLTAAAECEDLVWCQPMAGAVAPTNTPRARSLPNASRSLVLVRRRSKE